MKKMFFIDREKYFEWCLMDCSLFYENLTSLENSMKAYDRLTPTDDLLNLKKYYENALKDLTDYFHHNIYPNDIKNHDRFDFKNNLHMSRVLKFHSYECYIPINFIRHIKQLAKENNKSEIDKYLITLDYFYFIYKDFKYNYNKSDKKTMDYVNMCFEYLPKIIKMCDDCYKQTRILNLFDRQ